jgi:hypothetical protein
VADAPATPWTLQCPWCPWHVVVSARGQRGADQGAGVEAARLGEHHAFAHGRTWSDFLASSSRPVVSAGTDEHE